MATEQIRRALGRLPAEDLRDMGYLLRAARPQAFAAPVEALPERMTYRRGPILDQGQTSCCVEFSLEGKLRGAPIQVGQRRLPPRYAVYDAAILVDEFPDNDGDTERALGTSVRAGCKVLKQKGLIQSYHWAYSVDEILQWLLSGQGGLVLGIDWHARMSEPTDEGVIRPTGAFQGGHAILAYGADRTTGFVYLQNSWGEEWGGWRAKTGRRMSPGCCKLPLDDLHTLLRGNGEAVAIIETPYGRPVAVGTAA